MQLKTQHSKLIPMTTTTHISASCVIAALAVRSGSIPFEKLLVVAATALVAHYIIDLIPHGFIADPTYHLQKVHADYF